MEISCIVYDHSDGVTVLAEVGLKFLPKNNTHRPKITSHSNEFPQRESVIACQEQSFPDGR